MADDWPEIPDTPEQNALISAHNAKIRREYPDLVDVDAPTIVGVDLSDGVEMHVEGEWRDGVLHITDSYEIINHKSEGS